MGPISIRRSSSNGAGRALQPHGTARPGSRTNFAHEFQGFDVSNNVFSSEASYEEDRLVFSAVQSTALSRNDAAHRWGHWSRHFTDDGGHAVAQNPAPAARFRRRMRRWPSRMDIRPMRPWTSAGTLPASRAAEPCTTRWSICSPGHALLGETFEMRALPGKKHTLFDSLSAIGQRLRRRSEQLLPSWTSPRASSTSSRESSAATASTSTTTCWAIRISHRGCRFPSGTPVYRLRRRLPGRRLSIRR